MRVLVFGASITQGFWDTEGGWVARLRKYYDELEVKDFEDKQPTIFNLGISGDTTKGVLKRLKNETEARTWPGQELAFIFCIGTNNTIIKDGKNLAEPYEYAEDLQEIINQAKKFTDKIMFVELPPCDEKLTQPVAWANVHYTNNRISLFNKTINSVAEKNNLPLVAIFEEFQKQFNSGDSLFADGLHPNNDGHELIFRIVRPELDKLLTS